jgi:TrmH RNA methyltransferase
VVAGLHAARAAFRRRPADALRLFFLPERRLDCEEMRRELRQRRLPYREVGPEELERIAGTSRHGGVALVCRPAPTLEAHDLLADLGPQALIVALDGVGNPHNLGAIVRTAAWFGADALVLRGDLPAHGLSAAALRVAEGGAECVPLCPVRDLGRLLLDLARRGVTTVALDQRAPAGLEGAALAGPVCLVLGEEEEGLSPAARHVCRLTLAIRGTGQVESLSVSVAAGIAMAAVRAAQGRAAADGGRR